MSRLRANQITNENANGAPNFPHGLTVTGIVTATTTSTTLPQIIVGSAVTANSTGIDVTGIVTATSFKGNGANLTGITQTAINNNADNRIITGSGTANTLEAESALTFDGTTLQVAAADDIRIAGGTWTGEYNGGIKIQPDATNSYIQYQGALYFRNTSGSNKLQLVSAGHLTPGANNTQDLGSSSARWANIYTNDLNLSNKGSSNDVDGTWGDWTIQEGESDLFLKNNRSGKKYKFNLTEVS